MTEIRVATVTTIVEPRLDIPAALQVEAALEYRKEHLRTKLDYLIRIRLRAGVRQEPPEERTIAGLMNMTDRALVAVRTALYGADEATLAYPDENPGSWWEHSSARAAVVTRKTFAHFDSIAADAEGDFVRGVDFEVGR